MKRDSNAKTSITRRGFLAATGAAAAGSTIPIAATELETTPEAPAAVRAHRVLGRTGFKVSDIALGGSANDSNVIRYAYDHGINYLDTAESYGNGDSERRIGEAMQHMDRSKIFITTKLELKDDDTEATLVDRFGQCLQRMRTEYADALLMHSVTDVKLIESPAFHAAVKRLKGDGRLRYAGISSHGPRGEDGDSMAKVLCAAAEDGRFDILLLVYSFMNAEEGEKVLAACKKHNVGTTAMKTAPGTLEVEPFDPENPAKRYADYIDRQVAAGNSREEAIKDIKRFVADQETAYEEARPFREKHGLKGPDEVKKAAVQWVLRNPDMHTICLGLRDFEAIDKAIALSGTRLASAEIAMLEDYRLAHNSLYCRHGCTTCVAKCRHGLPVSTIMRYSYYFALQGREKHAISRYAALDGKNASACVSCDATCLGACPHKVPIRAQLLAAHSLLSMA